MSSGDDKRAGAKGHRTELTLLEARQAGRNAGWRERGYCFGTNDDQMFPDTARGQREVAKVCQTMCEVQAECLAYALEADERWGVWGGTTEKERERLRKRKGRE